MKKKIQMIKKIKYIVIAVSISFIYTQTTLQLLDQPMNANSIASFGESVANKSKNISTNPASLSVDGVSIHMGSIQFPVDINGNHLGITFPLHNYNIGISYSTINYGILEDSQTNNEFRAYENSLTINNSMVIRDWLSLGGKVEFVQAKIDCFSLTGFSTFFGFQSNVFSERLSIGYSFENAGKLVLHTGDIELLVNSQRFGISYQLEHIPAKFSVDYKNRLDDFQQIIGLIKWSPSDLLSFKFGIDSKVSDLSTGDYYSDIFAGLSLGISFDFNKLSTDIAIHNLGPAGNVYGASLQFRL
jgi:hypothetical protein